RSASLTHDNPLSLPPAGTHELRILTSNRLELTLITTKAPDPAPIDTWNFVGPAGEPRLPAAAAFDVRCDGAKLPVKTVGFKRRVAYAPLARRDLRIANELYLELSAPIPEGHRVEVHPPTGAGWPRGSDWSASFDANRWSPVLHVNQTGYATDLPKRAMIGYFLG